MSKITLDKRIDNILLIENKSWFLRNLVLTFSYTMLVVIWMFFINSFVLTLVSVLTLLYVTLILLLNIKDERLYFKFLVNRLIVMRKRKQISGYVMYEALKIEDMIFMKRLFFTFNMILTLLAYALTIIISVF